MELEKVCSTYVAYLRSLYLLHQNHHWITSGPGFYGNHLLFERIYKSAAENADLAAEKFVGVFGVSSLEIKKQPELIQKILNKYSTSQLDDANLNKMSLQAEIEFLKFAEDVYDQFESSEHMSLGIDDALMEIASKREEATYLLKQSAPTIKNSRLILLANKFQVKLS